MHVVFVLTETAEEVLQMVSDDVAGLLAAVKGDSVSFPFGAYEYDSHTLDHYLLENNTYQQELVIYLKPEQKKNETLLPIPLNKRNAGHLSNGLFTPYRQVIFYAAMFGYSAKRTGSN